MSGAVRTAAILADLPPGVADRFWPKVDRRGPNDCWPWQGARGAAGYGKFRVGKLIVYAHQVAYALEHGAVPQDKELHHTCHTPSCCNPRCLQPVTIEQHGRLRRIQTQYGSSVHRYVVKSGVRWRVMFRVGTQQFARSYAALEEAEALRELIRKHGSLKVLQRLKSQEL